MTYGGSASDEWTLCENLGSQCGPVLEERYATWITTADIDKLAGAGIGLLRVPTTYAAWIDLPGSELYHGNQTTYLKSIATYAIETYSMHIVIDLHSLPGGTNGLPIGEKFGNYNWWNNATALSYSYSAIDAVVDFIQNSGHPEAYTIEPINEPGDSSDLSLIGTPAQLSESGSKYLAAYFNGVIDRVAAVNPDIPIMLQGGFKNPTYWAEFFSTSANIVFDVHQYWFGGLPSDSDSVSIDLCASAAANAGNGVFPAFLGEWSIQTISNNLLANREKNVQAGLYAADKFLQGSAYWTAKFKGNATVDGEGTQEDYWNFETFIDLGYVSLTAGAEYCA